MGYESKVYVVLPYGETYGDELPYAEILASFKLCKMGAFCNLFNEKRADRFYHDDGNTEVIKDEYGAEVKYAESNQAVIQWLEKAYPRDNYWREKILLDFLKSLEESGREYRLYHYGY